ncbi:MAG: hypothetical protein EPO67_02260 [Reyranella sp.]|nr:MAG: hypothetical protein EPO67_02260 [Reyranella sp.]
MGIPIVAPHAAGFAQQAFAQGWGTPIREHSADGVANAVLEACDRLNELRDHLRPPEDQLTAMLREVTSKAESRHSAGTLRRLAYRLLGN